MKTDDPRVPATCLPSGRASSSFGERLFEARVTSVRAVMGPDGQHGWTSRDSQPRVQPSVQAQGEQCFGDYGPRDLVDHWDVSYEYRGNPHLTQMISPPGATIAVNANGEPRER